MAVQVEWFATLVKRTRSRQPTTHVEWRPGLTPMDILREEGFSDVDAESVMPVLDDEQLSLTSSIPDGATLRFIVSISGG